MSCRHFARLWKRSERPYVELVRLHSPSWTLEDRPPPTFKRIDAFWKAQPPIRPPKPCRCGSADKWRCWHQIKTDLLLGEKR